MNFLLTLVAYLLIVMAYSQKGKGHAEPLAGYRLRDMTAHDASSYFLRTLGCKKTNKAGETRWDSEIFVWEVGQRIQKGEFSLDDFMYSFEEPFEKDYKFKDSLTEWAPLNTHLKPENSSDLNLYKDDRKSFLAIVRNLLQPFSDEQTRETSALRTPQAYANSYDTYKSRMKAFDEWKTKFPKKVTPLCPDFYTRPEDKSASYHKSVHSKNLQDEHDPPVDILARRFLYTLGCESFVSQMPHWYVGERLRRGDFNLDQWNSALNRELDAAIKEDKLDDDDRDRIFNDTQNILTYFKPPQALSTPVPRAFLASAEDPLVKNYREIRQTEIRFTHWLTLQRMIEKHSFPCDSNYNMAKTSAHKRAGELFDQAQVGLPTQSAFCSTQKNDLEKKYEKEFNRLKGELETVFYGASLARYDAQSPLSPESRMEEISQKYQAHLGPATGNVLAHASKLIEETEGKFKDHLRQVTAHAKKGENRIPNIIFQEHIEDITRLWNSKFLIGEEDPSQESTLKAFEKEVEALNRKHALQMVLACLESDGRLYFSSTHNNEDVSTGFYPLHDSAIKTYLSDTDAAFQVFAKRKKLEAASPAAHHFDEETNWSGGQISFNQVGQSNPAGRFYYTNMARILSVTKDQKKIDRPAALDSITRKCQLEKLFKHAGLHLTEEIQAASKQLLESMSRSLSGYQYSAISWATLDREDRIQVVQDFAYIQMFCAPLHLELTEKVFKHNPDYFGSLRDGKDRIKNCAGVGDVYNPSSPALNDLSKNLLVTLKQNHPKLNPQAPALATPAILRGLALDFAIQKRRAQENTHAEEILESLKEDKEITRYFEQLNSASMHEGWKLFTLSEEPLQGWDTDYGADTAQHIAKAQAEYIAANPADKDFAAKKATFLAAQKERRNRSLWQMNGWAYRNQDKFAANKRSDFSSAMGHMKDRFEALHDMYDNYERELVDQMRTCKVSFPAETEYLSVLPRYAPPLAPPPPSPPPTKLRAKPAVKAPPKPLKKRKLR